MDKIMSLPPPAGASGKTTCLSHREDKAVVVADFGIAVVVGGRSLPGKVPARGVHGPDWLGSIRIQ